MSGDPCTEEVNHQSEEALNPSARPVLLERPSDRRLPVHHGSRDGERRVALGPDTVHVPDRVAGQSVDEDTGGVGPGHAVHLEDVRADENMAD